MTICAGSEAGETRVRMLGVPIGSLVGSLLRKGFQQEGERAVCYLMIHRVGGRTGTIVKALRSGRGVEVMV